METTFQYLGKSESVWASRVVSLRLPKEQCLPGKVRHVPDMLAIQVSPAILKAALNDIGTFYLGGTCRTRLNGGAYMGILDVGFADKRHVSIFHPRSKEFACWVRRVNSRGYLRICPYDLLGRFFIVRAEVPDGKFFESTLEVHDVSRGVSSNEFLQAVSFLQLCVKQGELEDKDWLPSDRSKILAMSVADAGDGKGC